VPPRIVLAKTEILCAEESADDRRRIYGQNAKKASVSSKFSGILFSLPVKEDATKPLRTLATIFVNNPG
jgi:hypothetical protein